MKSIFRQIVESVEAEKLVVKPRCPAEDDVEYLIRYFQQQGHDNPKQAVITAITRVCPHDLRRVSLLGRLDTYVTLFTAAVIPVVVSILHTLAYFFTLETILTPYETSWTYLGVLPLAITWWLERRLAKKVAPWKKRLEIAKMGMVAKRVLG